MTKEKFGKIAHDLILQDLQTNESQQHNMQDQTDAMLEDFDEHVYTAIHHGRGAMSCIEYNTYQAENNAQGCNIEKCRPFDGDFFIEVIQYKPKLFPNTVRQAFIARKSCPTPNYDQLVFRWDSGLQQIDEVWALGTRLTCFYFLQNARQLKPEFFKTFDYIKRFESGELFRLCKQLNNEQDDTPELVKKELFTVH